MGAAHTAESRADTELPAQGRQR